MIETALFATAVVFAVVNGTNAGGALLSTGLTLRSIRPVVGLVVLMVAVFAAPLLVGTQVATTLAQRLVTLDGQSGQLALMIVGDELGHGREDVARGGKKQRQCEQSD